KKKPAGDEEADWSLAKSNENDQEADWSLAAHGNAKEADADWSLKAKGGGEELEGDFRNKKDDAGEITLDYSKPNETWEKKRQENHKKSKGEDYDRERFRRIRLKRFYNFSKVCCDVYIQLSVSKYIKLLNANDSYESFQIEKYEEKGKKYLFIENIHYQRFQEQFGNLVLNKLEKAQNMPPEIKVVAELAAFEHTLRSAKEFGVTAITANHVKRSVESNLKTLKKLPNLDALLKRIMRGGDYISEHSLLMSYFAGQICMATSWGNPQSIEKLSMAALLHDVALTDDRLAHIHTMEEAKRMDLSREEIEIVRNHPGEAAKLISEGENIFADVDTIVLQHHEQPDQSGFPRGLGALSISPLSCVFILASELAEHVYGKEASDVDMEAIKVEFKDKFSRGNFKKPLEAFLKVF
ncbi:MAG: HD domain-containing protein, partial [Halobacteriovoraceae bacterium]|nr:HD domain-containing protein [Halobacteriovoraceae bacterium]